MKDSILLTITVTSLASFAAMASPQQAPAAAPTAATSSSSHGGKCASGKCGTEKIYSKAQLKQDPNGLLVRARDGKCGPSGKGYQVTETKQDKLAQGVCGR